MKHKADTIDIHKYFMIIFYLVMICLFVAVSV
ncbi:MAG: hypothetical protein RL222_773 [Bacteroidota bacterium]|jgi:hypothetical protein